MPIAKTEPAVVPVGRPDARDLAEPQRRLVARVWARRAAEKRATSMVLSELAAALLEAPPPDGRAWRVTCAARDELRHAALCRSLAEAYAELGPPHATATSRAVTPPDSTLTAFEHGCLWEVAQLAIWRLAREQATDSAVLRVLGVLVDDGVQHTSLAWELIAGAPYPARARLAQCASGLVAQVVHRLADRLSELPLRGVPAHGCPDADQVASALCDGFAELIWPGMERADLDPSGCAAWFDDHGQRLLLDASFARAAAQRSPPARRQAGVGASSYSR